MQFDEVKRITQRIAKLRRRKAAGWKADQKNKLGETLDQRVERLQKRLEQLKPSRNIVEQITHPNGTVVTVFEKSE